MSKDYRTEDGAQIAPLSRLSDFQVAEGYRDIRGWRVDSSDGEEVGKVHDLLVDLDGMRTRYIDVRLDPAIAASQGERNVLVPIWNAEIAETGDVVVVPLTADRVSLLPAYDHSTLTRAYESEVRRHFSLGNPTAGAEQGGIRVDQSETRVPVEPDDTVMLKRGEGGRDEIIVRGPHTP
jgi:photosynthetic reaction center H subunit